MSHIDPTENQASSWASFRPDPTPATPTWKPGDVANGHVLTEDGAWVPIASTSPTAPAVPWPAVAIALILAGAVLGVIMSMQTVTLMTGTGIIWTGAAIAAAACIAAWVVRGMLPTWVVVVVTLVAAYALVNAFYVEHQADVKRQEISQILND